jgi:hypothetical protein
VVKKDTSVAVLGMLSTAGSQTRPNYDNAPTPESSSPSAATSEPAPSADSAIAPAAPATPPPGRIHTGSTAASVAQDSAEAAPRTLRLRASTAAKLRAAWVEAKRDDVFLTAQDFASNLLDEALAARKRRARAERSA